MTLWDRLKDARPPGGLGVALVFALFLAAVVGLQWRSGAFQSEFGGLEPDESAHYLTGLMVRDYLAALAPAPPLKFAENYYLHYPRVAFGMWPPFYHVSLGVWTLIFSSTQFSVLLFTATCTALLALTLQGTVRAQFGLAAGMAAGLLFISLPLVQAMSGMAMTDILYALLSFWAVLSFGRFLDTERWQHSAVFGLLAALAILTKYNGLGFALVPLLGVALSGRFRLLTRPAFWLPLAIVVALCAPWYWTITHLILRDIPRGTEEAASDPSSASLIGDRLGLLVTAWKVHSRASRGKAVGEVVRTLGWIVGLGLSLGIATGFGIRLWNGIRNRSMPGLWAAAAAWPVSVWILHATLFPDLEPRYLLTTLPPLILFLVAGVDWVAARLPVWSLSRKRKAQAMALVLCLIYAGETLTIPEKPYHGFTAVAEFLLSKPELGRSSFLVSSAGHGEGMLISEIAMRETPRPGHIILRATKLLARKNEYDFLPLHSGPAQIMGLLDSIPVGVLVLDLSPGRYGWEHHRQLQEAVKEYPERWQLLASFPGKGGRGEIRVYHLVGSRAESGDAVP